MVTAADGAEEFYDLGSNVARYESIEEAVAKDKKLRVAYMGHQNWVLITNNKDEGFEKKIWKVKQAIHSFMGGNTGSVVFKKFLVQK